MSWIQTYTGKSIDLFEPQVEQICLEDIAHALSRLARFNGHTKEAYSVAQHSVGVADLAVKRGLALHDQQACLLHDAAEAYLGDVVRPLKRTLPAYWQFEESMLNVILSSLRGVDFWYLISWRTVKKLDRLHYYAEARDLFLTKPERPRSVPPVPQEVDEIDTIVPWKADKAKELFLSYAEQLQIRDGGGQ